MNLNEVAKLAVESYLQSPKAIEKIGAVVESTVNRAIEETLSSYSEFGKQLKKSVEESLRIRGEIELPEYNQTILNLIAAQLEKATQDSIQRQVAERMTDLLEPAPAEIKLSELVEEYRKYLKDRTDSGCVCDSSHEFHFSIRESSGSFLYVQFSEEQLEKHGQPDIEFGLAKRDRDGVKRYEMFTLSFDQAKNVQREMFAGPLYGFQRRLFQMHAAKTAVIVDVSEDGVDTSYGDHD